MLPPAMVAVPASSSVIVTVGARAEGFNVTPILLPAVSPSINDLDRHIKIDRTVDEFGAPKLPILKGSPVTQVYSSEL